MEPTVADVFRQRHEAQAERIWQYGSAGRPWAFLAWINDRHPFEITDPIFGQLFWEKLKEHWSSFDAIPVEEFSRWMRLMSTSWKPDEAWKALPEVVEAYRGQDARLPKGLSWTLSKDVARGFAIGHRGLKNGEPVILKARIPRYYVAFCNDNRNEHEIVLFHNQLSGIRVRKEKVE